jgi:hypothetical protein
MSVATVSKPPKSAELAVTPTQAAAYAASDIHKAVTRALKLLEGVIAIFDASVDDERGLSEGERWGCDYIVDATVDTLTECQERVRECMHILYGMREEQKATTARPAVRARKAAKK